MNYTVTVTNTGNVTLTGVTVVDPLHRRENISGETLAARARRAQIYNTSYTLTQADLDSNGGGDGDIDNTATADSDQTGPDTDASRCRGLTRAWRSNKVFINVTGGDGDALADAAGRRDELHHDGHQHRQRDAHRRDVSDPRRTDPLTGQEPSAA